MKCAIFSVVVLLFACTHAANVTYVFGVNLGLNATEAGRHAQSQVDSLRGYEIARDWWNGLPSSARTTTWGDVVDVELHVATYSKYGGAEWNYQGAYDSYANMSANASIDYFFPTTAWAGVKVREYTYQNLGVQLMVSPSDSSEVYYSIPGSFGTPTANVLRMSSWLPYLRIEKAKTLSVVYINDGIYQSEMCSGAVSAASLNGLTVLNHFSDMPFDWGTLGQINGIGNRSAVWSEVLSQVRASNPDAVIICDYSYGAEFSLNYMRINNWTPKLVGISPINTEVKFQDPSLLNYVVVPSLYSPLARYVPQANFTDSAGYAELVIEKYGVPSSPMMAESTLAAMLYLYAIKNSPSNSTDDVMDTLRRSQVVSFMGTSAFDVNGRQTMPSLMMQLTQNGSTTHIVGPPLAATATLIYPIPTWSERAFSPRWGSSVEIAAVVLMSIGVVSNVIWVLLIVINRENDIIRASSPVFCLTLLLGGTIAYLSILSWMPNFVNNASCSFRALALPLGFMMLFGSLIAKSDRIYRIFSLNTIDVIRISDLQVFCIVAVILVIQVILSILYTTVTQLTAVIRVVDEHRVSLNYYICTSSPALKYVFGVNLTYTILLLAWGTYLAYHIRLIPYSRYDESKTMIFSFYNAVIFCAIVIVIQLSIGNSNRNLTFMITAVGIFLGVTITTCTLFIPKFKQIYLPSEYSSSDSSRGSSRNTSTGHASVESLKMENMRLKARLDKLSKSDE